MYNIANSMAEAISIIEDQTNKEIECISFYVTGEVKDIVFVVYDLLGDYVRDDAI